LKLGSITDDPEHVPVMAKYIVEHLACEPLLCTSTWGDG
jgi:hypothetical protein